MTYELKQGDQKQVLEGWREVVTFAQDQDKGAKIDSLAIALSVLFLRGWETLKLEERR